MEMPYRKSPRLKSWDYSSDACYFVTFCTKDKKHYLGEVMENQGEFSFSPTNIAKEVQRCIEMLLVDRSDTNIKLHNYVIMPNHVHLLFSVESTSASKVAISRIVGSIKAVGTREARKAEPGLKVWQRSFHDHIVRSDADFQRIWEYIENNPAKWCEDCFYEAPSEWNSQLGSAVHMESLDSSAGGL